MGKRIIWETENFVVLLPERPHIPREDGGHICITTKEHYTDRTELPPALATELIRLSQITGIAYKKALSDGGVTVSRINYQENGNWAFRNGNSYPPFFHLHLYGRTEDSGSQEWGQALRFPDPDTGYYDGFSGLTEEDLAAFSKYMTELSASEAFSEEKYRL